MKKLYLLLAICLLILGFAIEGCNSSGNSAIVGEWEYIGTTWTFYSDGSFSIQSWDFSNRGYLGIGKPNVSSGNYKIKGQQLVLDYSGKHYEYTWSKPDENHLTFGNDAAGYWRCERKR